MGLVDEAFESLFFGSGSWLGLMLLLILALTMLLKWRPSGVLFMPIMIFLGIDYLTNNLGWEALIMFFSSIFILLYMVKGFKR